MIFRKSQKERSVAFDVGTVSISAALFEQEGPGRKPALLKTFRRFHDPQAPRDPAYFGKATASRFVEILEDVKGYASPDPPMHYAVGLSSLFYLGKTERISVHYPHPRVFKESDIRELVEAGKKKFHDDVKRTDIVTFETVLMKTFLNGYPVPNPIGKNAQDIELLIHIAATSNELFTTFTENIKALRRNSHVVFSTFPVATWSLLRQSVYPEETVLLVDVGGELTEVTFLAQGAITDTLALPYGVLNILTKIAEAEQIDIENALVLLKGYTGGELAENVEKRLRDIIRKEMKSWEEAFERVWQYAVSRLVTNMRVFFMGGGALIDEMKNSVTPPLLHPEIAKNLSASMISPDAFHDKFETTTGLDGPGDFGLLALVLNNVR